MSKLYIVPTPIGNLEDMTFRAVNVLKAVDVILAEDTRKTAFLLKHFSIENRLMAHHKFNEHRSVSALAERIAAGETIALVTDAGTPSVSDPGFLLVRECVTQNIDIECLPGATAFVPALVVSGLPSDKFCFEGFLPHKKGRQKRLKQLAAEERTMVFYESPYRLLKALQQMAEHFGSERQAAVSRELTKHYEETRRGTLAQLAAHFETTLPKGEFVITVAGAK